jgi:hypothetical protein
VILAGGAGSGKGFILKNMIGVDGKVFDVDALKSMTLGLKAFERRLKNAGIDPKDKDILKDSEAVSILHSIVSDSKLMSRKQSTLFNSVIDSSNDRKPNIIFDVTLKDVGKLEQISETVTSAGYQKEDIHIVWVLNELDTAIQQNMERDRKVNQDILVSTHVGVSSTMNLFFKRIINVRRYMDGDFWIVFNKRYVDSMMAVSTDGGAYVKDAIYYKVKDRSSGLMKVDDIADEYIKKIRKYVPDVGIW